MRKSAERSDYSTEVKALGRADQVLQLLRKSTAKLDPSVLQRLKEVDEGSREAALLLARGGEHIERTVPDIAGRAHFLQEGGADTVAAVGRWVRTRRRKHSGWTRPFAPRVRRCAPGATGGRDLGAVRADHDQRRGCVVEVLEYVCSTALEGLAGHGSPGCLPGRTGFVPERCRATDGSGVSAIDGACGVGRGRSGDPGAGKGSEKAARTVEDALSETFFSRRTGLYAVSGVLVLLLASALVSRRDPPPSLRRHSVGPRRVPRPESARMC